MSLCFCENPDEDKPLTPLNQDFALFWPPTNQCQNLIYSVCSYNWVGEEFKGQLHSRSCKIGLRTSLRVSHV